VENRISSAGINATGEIKERLGKRGGSIEDVLATVPTLNSKKFVQKGE
jgi:hypothetical protein